MTGEGVRKAGFWMQLVLLALVDWGTLVAFSQQHVHAIHYVGFVVVNVALLAATFVIWRWLRHARADAGREGMPSRPDASETV